MTSSWFKRIELRFDDIHVSVGLVFLVGVCARAATIYREIGNAADNTLLHIPRHVAVGLAVGYETLPAAGWHHFFMMVGLDIG